MKNFFLFILLSIRCYLFSQSNESWEIGSIPLHLLSGKDYVIRLEEHTYTYNDATSIKHKKRIVTTILNENGLDEASASEYFSSQYVIKDFEGNLFDGNGKKIKSLKNKDIGFRTASNASYESSDGKVKYASFQHSTYPFTVEFITEVEYKNSHVNLLAYYEGDEKVSYQSFLCTFDLPLILEHEIYQTGESIKKKTEQSKERLRTIFEKKDFTFIKSDPLSKKRELNIVACSLTNFEYGKYKGKFQDWKDYGNFMMQLNEGRDELPEKEKLYVKEIISNKESDYDKAKALYEYMQSKTRYVSIQYGIGGHQTFPAEDVINRGFGDCKALSNYMYSLLKEAGIKSHYTLVYAGDFDYQIDYTKTKLHLFNHVILCLPTIKDTLWLECTSQTQPFGFQGDFTSNRQVLIIEKDNSKIVRTKKYGYKDNISISVANLKLESEVLASASVSAKYTCELGDEIASYYYNYPKEEYDKYLNSKFDIPSYNVKKYEYSYDKNELPILNESLEIDLPYFANVSGNRMFIVPNLFSKSTSSITYDSTRTSPFYVEMGYTIIDTIFIGIPEGYKVESSPKTVDLKNEFMEYNLQVLKSDNQLIYIRRSIIKEGTYPASLGKNMFESFKKKADADKAKIVFVKK